MPKSIFSNYLTSVVTQISSYDDLRQRLLYSGDSFDHDSDFGQIYTSVSNISFYPRDTTHSPFSAWVQAQLMALMATAMATAQMAVCTDHIVLFAILADTYQHRARASPA